MKQHGARCKHFYRFQSMSAHVVLPTFWPTVGNRRPLIGLPHATPLISRTYLLNIMNRLLWNCWPNQRRKGWGCGAKCQNLGWVNGNLEYDTDSFNFYCFFVVVLNRSFFFFKAWLTAALDLHICTLYQNKHFKTTCHRLTPIWPYQARPLTTDQWYPVVSSTCHHLLHVLSLSMLWLSI